MAEPVRQADRKAGEAREVRRISAAVGLSALGLTCGLSAVTAVQAADQGSSTATTQPVPVAAAPRQIEEIDEEVVVQVPAPRPPAHAPAAVATGGAAARRQTAPLGGAAAAQAAAGTATSQAAPAAGATASQTVSAAPPVAAPKPVAVSTASKVR
ncbi:MAG TPA: hypothetical protein VIK45_22100 [Candidatus Dormibacteraeota bacterium]